MTTRPLLFLDIETTGGSPHASRITEIGALRVEGDEIVGTFSQLINPEEPIPSFITRLTGIDNDMVWQAPTFKAIAEELEQFMDGALFIAHNVSFDFGFIKAEYARLGLAFGMDRMCTARLSRALYPDQPRHNLDTIIARHNIQVVNRHRALDDARVLYEFYQIALRDHKLDVFRHMDKLTKKHR